MITKNKKQDNTFKTGWNTILSLLLIIIFTLTSFFAVPATTKAESDVGELNLLISKKRKEINILQKEIDAYDEQIAITKKEARGLRNQIAILDNQIAKVNLDIEATGVRIEQTNLEIQATNIEINNTEERITAQKERISEYLRLIYKSDQVNFLEVLLTNNSFSDFFDQIKYTQDIHNDLKGNVDKLQGFKLDLEIQKQNWETKAEHERELKIELQSQKSDISEKNTAQGILLIQAKLTEREYANYSYQLKLEQQSANSDIFSLEKKIRIKLEEREAAERFAGFGPARLSWPVSPARGITAFFHDPDYPFRYLFEHPAIDIRSYQGSPIKTPESGYVARVKFRGDTSYAYIMIIHNNGLSTVFGHINKALVKEDEYVIKGQTIALSGGAPGSLGAGRLSTGPHLHFEVRLNGIPVNPLEYLPSY